MEAFLNLLQVLNLRSGLESETQMKVKPPPLKGEVIRAKESMKTVA